MSSRERFLSENIARLGWKIPGLDYHKKSNFQEFITKKEHKKLNSLKEKVLQKLQVLDSRKNTGEASGFRSPILFFKGELVGENGNNYSCAISTDVQRLEIEVTDLSSTDKHIIRKYREFLGRFEINDETATWDLSCLGDQTFSWRCNFSDHDYPEKSLTLKESCKFMEEILSAHLKPLDIMSSKKYLNSNNI